jgi:hypothetical protein
MHPTHRKLRDGWGTRAFVAGGEQATITADPPPSAKDDNQRAKDDNQRAKDDNQRAIDDN